MARCGLTSHIAQAYGWTNATATLVYHMARFCLLEVIKKSKNRFELNAAC